MLLGYGWEDHVLKLKSFFQICTALCTTAIINVRKNKCLYKSYFCICLQQRFDMSKPGKDNTDGRVCQYVHSMTDFGQTSLPKSFKLLHFKIKSSPRNLLSPLILKLPSLFAAWLFWTFHTKPHNMIALVIRSHSWSPFHPLTCLYEKNYFYGSHSGLLEYFLKKNLLQITHANQMTMTTSGQI